MSQLDRKCLAGFFSWNTRTAKHCGADLIEGCNILRKINRICS